MTVENDNADNLDIENKPVNQPSQVTENEDWGNDEEDDPMLADLSAEEEKLKETVKAAQTGDGEPSDEEELSLDSEDGEPAEPAPAPAADDKASKMVPIERLNQVLDKAKTLEDTVNYQKGIIEVQSKALSTKATAAPAADAPQVADPNGVATPAKDLEAQITEAENKKIELAQKYEDGDIGYAEMQRQMVSLDKSIRDHQLARVNEVEQNSRKVAEATVQQNNLKQVVDNEALTLQQKHPYIAAIDQLPEHLKNGVWNQITSDAVANLLARGINPNSKDPEARIALVREKALLTDKYGPQYAQLPNQPQQPSTPQKPAISENAQNRAKKLDMASRQPPPVPQNIGTFDKEVTKDQIAEMDEDQLADMLTKNPELVERATGIKSK